MKKIILSAVAVITLAVVSQAQFKIGVKGGINEENQRVNVTSGTIYASDDFKSYHAGLIADISMGGNFYLQPQLLFSRKGATHLSLTETRPTEVRMSYVELPINVVYKFNLPFAKLFAGAGGAISYGIGGKEQQGSVGSKLYKTSNWKRGDLSLTFTAGLEFDNGFFVSANSQKGLRDVYRTDGMSVKSKSVSVSVGYFIDWKKFKRKS